MAEVEKAVCCIIKTEKTIGVLLVRDGDVFTIMGFEDVAEGLRYFETGYMDAHHRSFEGSMSACINNLSFQPSIVELTMGDIEAAAEKGTKAVTVRSVAGSVTLLPLKVDAIALWETGTKPRLIGG